jgi:hypothetical protein
MLLYCGVYILEYYKKERIIRYAIDVPVPASNGKAVGKPSIKVRAITRSLPVQLLTKYRRRAQPLFGAMLRLQESFSDW